MRDRSRRAAAERSLWSRMNSDEGAPAIGKIVRTMCPNIAPKLAPRSLSPVPTMRQPLVGVKPLTSRASTRLRIKVNFSFGRTAISGEAILGKSLIKRISRPSTAPSMSNLSNAGPARRSAAPTARAETRPRSAVSITQAALQSPTFASLAAQAAESRLRLQALEDLIPSDLHGALAAGPSALPIGACWCAATPPQPRFVSCYRDWKPGFRHKALPWRRSGSRCKRSA